MPGMVGAVRIEDTIARVWRAEAARIIGGLTRLVRDVSLAEEFAQDALVVALEQWPRTGLPENPGAWLMTTAKHRALNALQRARRSETTGATLVHELDTQVPLAELEAALEARMDSDVADDVLRLLFAACHPLLSKEARVTLTLRLVGGLSTAEIARAFLTLEPTIAQRIVRAKKTLGEARVPFEVPRGAELGPRLSSVLEVVYLIFNEGYSATAGEDLMRPALMDEAVRLGGLLASLAPQEPEVHGLVALMHLQASRAETRTDSNGEPVLLADQDRSRWNRAAISAGLEALSLAAASGEAPGPYVLQAELAACHARAVTIDATDWVRIVELYTALLELVPSVVIELNRAVAVARAQGPEAALELLDALQMKPELANYHLLPSARADVLERLGRKPEARVEFLRAAALAQNVRQKERLELRAAALSVG